MRTFALTSVALLLLVACTPSDTPENRPPKNSRAKQPVTTPTVPPNSPASSTATTDAPPPKPPTSQWWCVCYLSELQAGPQPTTSCRELESECRALERRIAKGGRGLITGSVSEACRAVQGEHPGDTLGGRDRWEPSKRAGAWTSEGACLLGPGPAVATGDQDEGEGVDPGEEADPFNVLAGESLGQLSLDMNAAQIGKLLGDPPRKGAVEEWAATGEYMQSWEYPDQGLTLSMAASTRHGPQSLASIHARSPSTLLTARKIGLGSSWDAVHAAYGDVHDQEGLDPGDKSMFTAGSVYGGVFFSFEGGKVVSIYMGAGAE